MVAVGVPVVKPVPIGWSTHNMLVKFTCLSLAIVFLLFRCRLTHEYGFSTGANVPGRHVKRPFSWKKPSSEEHPGPPLSLEESQQSYWIESMAVSLPDGHFIHRFADSGREDEEQRLGSIGASRNIT